MWTRQRHCPRWLALSCCSPRSSPWAGSSVLTALFPDLAHVELVSRECLLSVPGSEKAPMTIAMLNLLDKVAGKLSFAHQRSIRTTFLYRDQEKNLQMCSEAQGAKG